MAEKRNINLAYLYSVIDRLVKFRSSKTIILTSASKLYLLLYYKRTVSMKNNIFYNKLISKTIKILIQNFTLVLAYLVTFDWHIYF